MIDKLIARQNLDKILAFSINKRYYLSQSLINLYAQLTILISNCQVLIALRRELDDEIVQELAEDPDSAVRQIIAERAKGIYHGK